VEAIQRQPDTTKIALDRQRIEARRGRNIAKIAAARKLLTLVYCGSPEIVEGFLCRFRLGLGFPDLVVDG
ncbi:MAG: hypothetical protein WCB62_24645, partial [Pseudolabrys sp.]